LGIAYQSQAFEAFAVRTNFVAGIGVGANQHCAELHFVVIVFYLFAHDFVFGALRSAKSFVIFI
jgi:hypothetical protein